MASVQDFQLAALALAALPDSYAIAASSPADALYLLDKADPRRPLVTLTEHAPGGIREVRAGTVSNSNGSMLLSCGGDGAVKVWDARTRGVALQSTSGV